MLSSNTIRMSEGYKMCSVTQSRYVDRNMPVPDALEDPIQLLKGEQGYS